MTSCSSSSEEVQTPVEPSAVTPLTTMPTVKEAVHYLNLKFSKRFTSSDALFTEALAREVIPPPIVLNYNGKQPMNARRNNNFNNRRFDHDGSRRPDGRRFDNDRGGWRQNYDKKRYENDDHRSDNEHKRQRQDRR